MVGEILEERTMAIFDWIFGGSDEEHDRPRRQPPPIPSKASVGPDIDAGRVKTQTEKDLRRVEGQYDPDTDSFVEDKR
jgi:hypothetical protein